MEGPWSTATGSTMLMRRHDVSPFPSLGAQFLLAMTATTCSG